MISSAAAALALSACGGGGGSDAPRTYAVYGGSWTWGTVPEGRLAVPPAVRLSQLLGAPVADYSAGAATLRQAFGTPVLFWPDGRVLTADMLPHSPFPSHLLAHPADVVVFQYGGSEPLLGTPREVFYDLYRQAIEASKAGGCVPAIVGLYDHPLHPEFAEYDAIARRVARDTQCLYTPREADWPAGFVDDLHAGQELSDRWQGVIAEALKETA